MLFTDTDLNAWLADKNIKVAHTGSILIAKINWVIEKQNSSTLKKRWKIAYAEGHKGAQRINKIFVNIRIDVIFSYKSFISRNVIQKKIKN